MGDRDFIRDAAAREMYRLQERTREKKGAFMSVLPDTLRLWLLTI